MKKIIFLVLILTVFLVPAAFTQFRLDLGADVIVSAGIKNSGLDDDPTVNVISKYIIPIPEATFSYQFPLGPINLGAGLQFYTAILESITWPIVYAELDLSPFVVSLKTGGLGFLIFGLASDSFTGDVLVSDLNAAFKLGKSFRLGLGAKIITGKDLNLSNVPYIFYISGRFSTIF